MGDWEEFEETYLRRIRDPKGVGKMKVSGKEVFTLEKQLNKKNEDKSKRS